MAGLRGINHQTGLFLSQTGPAVRGDNPPKTGGEFAFLGLNARRFGGFVALYNQLDRGLSARRSLRLFLRVVGKYCDGSLRDIAH